MKRISNFKADRMDMKQMAAISGGAACHGSSTFYFDGCICTQSWSDDYYTHPVTGARVEYRYDYQTTCQ